MLTFSVIIPVKEINDYIKETVPITLDLDYSGFDIIILPNERPKTIPPYLRHKSVRVISTGEVSPAIKRDIGAKHSTADVFCFLDDDAYPRKDWLKRLNRAFKRYGCDAVGGPAVTPSDDTVFQKASGLVFETFVGGGGMSYRYTPVKRAFAVDDYPTVNLSVRRKAFEQVGGFDNNFWPGEDTKFCLDLVKNGYRIMYDPSVLVYHHRRNIFKGHLKQVYNYSKHRGYFARILPETSRRLVYFIPTFFVLFLLFGAFASLFFTQFFLVYAAIMGMYFLLVSFDVFSRSAPLRVKLLTVCGVFITHVTYGIGVVRGLFSNSFKSVLR